MLYGRAGEQAAIDELLAAARDGRSGSLVVRGEAGIGKSALLGWAAEAAAGLRVLSVTGIEAEADLAFGGLVQLLWPLQDRLATLPGPQAEALRAVLDSGGTSGQDRFVTGLAVLTLLADVADDGPVLCLIDDAQWLDRATAEALLFAARRLAADRVAMLFGARDTGFAAPDLPELHPARLDAADAGRLLAEHGLAPPSPSQIFAESAGNPLALLEFAAAQREHHVAAGPLPVGERVLAGFRAQISALPSRARLMMLLAAAEGRGHLPTLLGAAEALGVGLADLEQAETARLLDVTGTTIAFRHPLIGTAAYQGAALARRVAVHQALAESTSDADCRVRHLAAAATAPDERVAAEIAGSAERARARTAFSAAAGLYRQAARLTVETGVRAARLSKAASLSLAAGHGEQAAELVRQAEPLTEDTKAAAAMAQVRAAVEFERGDGRAAARLLVEHARSAESADAVAMVRTGARYAWFSGDRETVHSANAALNETDPLVRGMAFLVDDDFTAGLPLLAEFVARAPSSDPARTYSAMILGDDATARELASAEVARCRRDGLIGLLPQVLHDLAGAQVSAGLHQDAAASVAEAVRISRDTGSHRRLPQLNAVVARMAAIEGDERRCQELAEATSDAGGAASTAALALLDLGLGHYESTLDRMEIVQHGPLAYTTVVIAAAADQLEAAIRLGDPGRAEPAFRRFEAWATAGGQPWAQAVAARCHAMLGDDEAHYQRAVELHALGERPFERARTELLYGEWLRRARRRSDARVPLRSALKIFSRLHAKPWADRASIELEATGDSGPAAEPTAENPLDRLTPQELQVVRLAAEGGTSREIAAQLFLSPRTVEHHLYRAFPKLGVRTRRELARLDLGQAY
ncbi:helix-turn-helix transcriptional regulator [Amycolatopsis sp. WAC 01376]|uniref:ATP-binding protein n=1 Tax=Amycolatopsis sp. WAC 01376 TaxID=2203195 RepID=UPI000F7AF2E1|nr:LuxR family transcriptional regulator [Amycolatopsis sp. WAC 01376]RSM55154.1 helix-turn-helix transcriptional regulator [Amycolatopsis sp. WAC 01376]